MAEGREKRRGYQSTGLADEGDEDEDEEKDVAIEAFLSRVAAKETREATLDAVAAPPPLPGEGCRAASSPPPLKAATRKAY